MRTIRVLFEPRLFLLNALIVVLSPFLLLTKIARYLSKRLGREFDPNRWNCPVWRAGKPLPAAEMNRGNGAPHVVFLGTGFGEMRIVEQLSEALSRTHPHLQTTWATRDREAAQNAARNHPDQRISFMPFDFVWPTLNFLRHNRPDVVVFVEKFWFPNLACCCAAWGAQCVVVNARSRSHEGLRYRAMQPYHRWILSQFRRMCFQSDEDWRRVTRVLPPNVEAKVVGNLKFEVDPRATKADDLALQRWLTRTSSTRLANETPLLSAGSLSDEEEDRFVLDAFAIVRQTEHCALLIAPRRLHRVPDLVREIESRGWTVSLRSATTNDRANAVNVKAASSDVINVDAANVNVTNADAANANAANVDATNVDATESADVYVLDTMGELAVAYRFSQAAYVGGTLNSAGHNMAEPLYWGVPVSYGPSRGFFESVQKACEKAGVGFRVHSPTELAAHWTDVLQHPQKREQWRQDAQKLLDEQGNAVERNVQQIREVVDALTAS